MKISRRGETKFVNLNESVVTYSSLKFALLGKIEGRPSISVEVNDKELGILKKILSDIVKAEELEKNELEAFEEYFNKAKEKGELKLSYSFFDKDAVVYDNNLDRIDLENNFNSGKADEVSLVVKPNFFEVKKYGMFFSLEVQAMKVIKSVYKSDYDVLMETAPKDLF